MAQAVHNHSKRKDGPFVVVDCSAIPRDLIESELFGHVKGAFTGATGNRKGAFESAEGGTLFLDELGELDLDLQPKLLRALEKQQVKPVGSNDTVQTDVRIVAATNRNLMQEVHEGNFREDLYYRFAVIKVDLPPLRERTDDIPLLVEHFLEEAHEMANRDEEIEVSYKTMEKLKRHRWPGNVRELKNFVERAVLLTQGDQIETKFLQAGEPTPESPRKRRTRRRRWHNWRSARTCRSRTPRTGSSKNSRRPIGRTARAHRRQRLEGRANRGRPPQVCRVYSQEARPLPRGHREWTRVPPLASCREPA